MNNKIIFFRVGLILFLCFLFTQVSFAQTKLTKPLLEQTITIKYSSQRTDVVLNTISKLGEFNFSYNPSLINSDKLISGNFINKPVREILNFIFDGAIEYKEKKGHLILQKARKAPETVDKPEEYFYCGYVRDTNGAPLPWVSVYDRASLQSVISNDYGFYRIRFTPKQVPLKLYFSKQGFRDTSIAIKTNTPEYLNIALTRLPIIPPPVNYDSLSQVAENSLESFFKNLDGSQGENNISDTLYRKWQVSVLPFIGTNMKLNGNVINDYSFNLFGGLSMGTRKAELAGLFNINKSDVSYAQIAGFTNLVGGNVKGFQLAGFANVVKQNVRGSQIAGLVNADFSDAKGLAIAGLVNSVYGTTDGIQIAGLVNATSDTVKGFQIAGLSNVTGKTMEGFQIAGLLNVVADTLKGTQIGFANYTRHLNGLQVGFFNYSKSATSVPVGFLSYVNDGYHKIEISADEIIPINISLRTGVNALHNILTCGIQPFTKDSLLWNFGYGIGTSAKLSRKTFLDFDVTSSQMVKGRTLGKINLLNKIYLGIDTKLAKKFSLAFGVTVNGQLTKPTYKNYPDIFTYYEPHIFHVESWKPDNLALRMWLGGKVALRFL